MRVLLVVVMLIVPMSAAGQVDTVPADVQLERAGFEDYREPIGRIEQGVLRIALDARAAEWRPWGEDGPPILAHVFAADGHAPRVPAPLIRVMAGTPVHVIVRNTFDRPLVVRGLQSHAAAGAPAAAADSVLVAPHGTAEVRFTPLVPGTFAYRGQVRGAGTTTRLPGAQEANRPFVGILIVDPAGSAPLEERFFIIHHWADRALPSSFLPATRFFVNGRSWPHTERLHYQQGDTVRWRIINSTGRPHPMHLHGFHFRVDARGDLRSEHVYPPDERRLAVTEVLQPAHSMRLTWIPERPGNWIFHCHFMRHMSHTQNAPLHGDAASSHHASVADADLMGGIVVGISVQPAPGHVQPAVASRRRLSLHIGERAKVFGDEPGYGFVLQEGAQPPAADSVRFPGSTLVLRRGEPTEIVVHNRADVPLGVHWHGLELESWADGVPGWSGMAGSTVPAIQPGDSLAVRMTPPRAGTFMYHVHSEPGHQLAQGLYGAFLVLEPGQVRDPDSDRVFLLGSLGVGTDPPPAVNGELEPPPVDMRANRTYRLRFMHISPDDDKRVRLMMGDTIVAWQHVAKDGADLPANQARTIPADLRIHVGETYDVLWTPQQPGDYSLHIETTFDRGVPAFPRAAPAPQTQVVLLRVH